MERIGMSQEERDWLEWLKRAREEDDAAGGGRPDGSQRALGTQAVEADERRARPSGGAWAKGAGIEPHDPSERASSGDRDAEAAGLARLWTEVCQRVVGQTAR